jgi:hypothetical protein
MSNYQSWKDHDINQEGLRDTQEMFASAGHRSHAVGHDASITKGSAACQDCDEDCVDITWSEIVTRSATIHRSELADAVSHIGQDSDGHPIPDDLSDLYGDPWKHGDLMGLLGSLAEDEMVRLHTESDDPKVTSITPAG